jgi:hypothetical protein
MPPASRHAKPRTLCNRLGVPVVAAVALVGAAAAFVFLQGGSGVPRPVHYATPVTSAGSGVTSSRVATAFRRDVGALEARMVLRTSMAARSRHLAALAAARLARQQAAQRPTPTPTPTQTPTPSTSTSPAPTSGGTDAAHSPLGICIRNSEEGGSYAWGPGNGGGAYQFELGTWEKYGGAASEYGVAGPAYQDQIFDNAVAAGGASNWTSYDGC